MWKSQRQIYISDYWVFGSSAGPSWNPLGSQEPRSRLSFRFNDWPLEETTVCLESTVHEESKPAPKGSEVQSQWRMQAVEKARAVAETKVCMEQTPHAPNELMKGPASRRVFLVCVIVRYETCSALINKSENHGGPKHYCCYPLSTRLAHGLCARRKTSCP